ncbi:hypothetical protein [Flavobacterium sp.]|uniref:hypothetical protein n=1 Tax=Flavobacterium sp. TaxID=239 RepID=UPI001B48A4F5|nr:hypothetical protein [Flavobacterium sp.]MBP6126961.1 hypothetical protein [Flavobacterium sp.]
MKNLNFLLIGILFTTIISCSKDEQKTFDESIYFDQDPDCDLEANGYTCCDVDGRILVVPNNSYSYSYKGIANGNRTIENIIWSVESGSITIVSGQCTPNAIFKFGADFVNGKIQAQGKVGGCCVCVDIIEIKKI